MDYIGTKEIPGNFCFVCILALLIKYLYGKVSTEARLKYPKYRQSKRFHKFGFGLFLCQKWPYCFSFSFRVFYWFVMIEAIGPIAINIVRVFKDVLTTLITYGLFLVGFTMGFFTLLYYYLQSRHDLDKKVIDDAERRAEGLKIIAPKVILQLIFATFNPEEIDWEAINVINDTDAYPNQETDPKKPYKPGSIYGTGHYADFARAFLIAFLLVSVIVLMNVLIAAMNNTGL